MMTENPIKAVAESALLLIFARVAQVILVPLLMGMISWTFVSVTNLQTDVAKAIATSEANNRLLVEITGDLKQRVIRLEDKK